ncbi:MAG: protoporphyrinogen oxidase [Betaproteobacteria bacterium]|nr:protoporphyrinogen oxidase [Betaproteobacteria bacterium]
MSPTRSVPSKTVVIGAGISGLTVAHELASAGHDVIVLDRKLAPGGRINTVRSEGFLVEHGPTSMISPAPAAESLIDKLGLAHDRIDRGEHVKRRYLVRDGRAHALPMDAFGFFSSGYFTLAGRLRLLTEPFVRPLHDDETVAQFVRRRFGRELLDYVFDPLIGGLYAGDPERLSLSALFPQLKRLERAHGSIIRGVLAERRKGMGSKFDPRYRRLFSFANGMGTLPDHLMRSLSGRTRFGVRVEAIEPLRGGGFRLKLREGNSVSSLRACGVVVALPAYAAAKLLQRLSPEVSYALAGIEHPPLAVAALGFKAKDVAHPLDGMGVLTPTVEQRNVLGVLFSSSLFRGRAPEGHVLLTAYVGGARQPELARLPRADLERLVVEEARDLLGVRGEAVFSSVRYWRQGLPQPDIGHHRRIDALRTLEAEWPGIFVTGNYVSGVSISACVDAARATAARADVRSRTDRTDSNFVATA